MACLSKRERRRMDEEKAHRRKLILEGRHEPPPPAIRCLVCGKPMPLTWRKLSPKDDPVCASCEAMPIRPHTGWGGYAALCEDVSGDDPEWDWIVRLTEDTE